MATETVDTEILFTRLDGTFEELVNLVSPVDEDGMNLLPFPGSWTVAQLATHVTKSNNAIAQALDMEGTRATRPADQRVEQLRAMFLDFSTRFQSPDFITPEDRLYQREAVIRDLRGSIVRLKEKRSQADLAEVISLKVFSEISKLELLYFVLFHTQRHIRQLKNLIRCVNE